MSESTRATAPPALDPSPRPTTPVVEFVPGDEATGHCPTLRVDGALWHDPKQPYREVLALEGQRPAVVALLGVGLGYTAAGARHLSPGCVIVAWEPLPGMARSARKWLQDEWCLDDDVHVEGDLADFQARLIEACRVADSMAVVMLDELREQHPRHEELFLEIVQEVIDAGTFTLSPRVGSEGKWARIAANLPQLAATPELAALGGAGGSTGALVIAAPPAAAEVEPLARCAEECRVITVPDLLPSLERSGLRADLLVVGKSEGPSPELTEMARGCVLAITPDSAPEWWSCPARGRLMLGHTGCSWLLEEGDPGLISSFRYGPEIPMVVTALALGSKRVFTYGFHESGDASWNLLAASRRRERAIERIAGSSGAEIAPWSSAEPSQVSAGEKSLVRRLERADPSGGARFGAVIERAGRQTRVLLRELNRYRSTASEAELLAYLARRAECGGFTRSFLRETPFPGAHADLDSWARQLDRARAFLELARCQVPAEIAGEEGLSRAVGEHARPLQVFIGTEAGEELPAGVLRDQIRRISSVRTEIAFLGEVLEERLGPGARHLPLPVQTLLIPFLCGYEGRALYFDTSVVLLDDPLELWETSLDEAVALAPAAGPSSLLLIDNERCRWSPEEVMTRAEHPPGEVAAHWAPGPNSRTKPLPERWGHRDEMSLQTAAMRYTCLPWLPWKNDLHPVSWAWRFFLSLSMAEGRIADGASAAAEPHAETGEGARTEHAAPLTC